jgi:hypothetical protein
MQCSSNREFKPWEEGFEYIIGRGRLSLLGPVLEVCPMGSSVRVLGGSKSGRVKKSWDSVLIMRFETPALNWRTCLRMYRRKTSKDQRSMSMIVKTGTHARYMAMAPPDRIECVPMSRWEKPSTSSPMRFAAACSWVARKALLTSFRWSFVRTVLTRLFSLQPG